MTAKFTNLAVAVGQADAFSTPELLAIPDETLDSFYQAASGLSHYRLVLDRVRRQKPHTLSRECEALLAAAGQLGQCPDDIFSMVNDADMTFPDAVDSQGQSHPVTHGTFVPARVSRLAYCVKMPSIRCTACMASTATPRPPCSAHR